MNPMTNACLYKCFETHLHDLEIHDETEEAFVAKVVELYLLELSEEGFHFLHSGEDTYTEIRDEVTEILKKKTYGHFTLNAYREFQRSLKVKS